MAEGQAIKQSAKDKHPNPHDESAKWTNFDAHALLASISPSIVYIDNRAVTNQPPISGNGFFVHPNKPNTCEVITNDHVIKYYYQHPTVQTANGQVYAATVWKRDKPHDLAYLRIDGVSDPKSVCPGLPLAKSSDFSLPKKQHLVNSKDEKQNKISTDTNGTTWLNGLADPMSACTNVSLFEANQRGCTLTASIVNPGQAPIGSLGRVLGVTNFYHLYGKKEDIPAGQPNLRIYEIWIGTKPGNSGSPIVNVFGEVICVQHFSGRTRAPGSIELAVPASEIKLGGESQSK